MHLIEPLPYPDLLRLLARSELILTDSGGIQEEAPSLGVPVLVLRDSTERPEAVEARVARLIGTDRERLASMSTELLTDPAAHDAMAHAENPYGDGHAAAHIVDIIKQQFHL